LLGPCFLYIGPILGRKNPNIVEVSFAREILRQNKDFVHCTPPS